MKKYFSNEKARILLLIETLQAGGKERRFIELLGYLKNLEKYELLVLVTNRNIQYPGFLNLNIPYKIVERKFGRKDPFLFVKYLKVFWEFRPSIVHAWGSKVCFYSLPGVILFKTPLVNSQIADIFSKKGKSWIFSFINWFNFRFSSEILANSKSGAESYLPGRKDVKVIYNGINLNRFINLTDPENVKQKYGIFTEYAIIMVARPVKNYDLYFSVAIEILKKRNDISFLALGISVEQYKGKVNISDYINNHQMILIENSTDVESIVNACDIGVLFSEGEGISNAIIEYMALAKPVIASKTGGNVEIVENNKTGYLIDKQEPDYVAGLILDLIDNKEKRQKFGEEGRNRIHQEFTIDRMGKEFDNVYKALL